MPVRWAIGIILFVFVFAWFTAPNPVATSDDTDPFVGRWLINGVDPFGTEYSGSLSIVAVDDGYTLDWIVTAALASGTGTLLGDELVVDWERVNPQPDVFPFVAGTAQYRIDSTGNLIGEMQSPGAAEQGSEVGEPAG